MCCLSEASSHFVVFVCVNPDRKPSRKMKRRNKEAVVRALFPFGQQHVDKLRDRMEATLVVEAFVFLNYFLYFC